MNILEIPVNELETCFGGEVLGAFPNKSVFDNQKVLVVYVDLQGFTTTDCIRLDGTPYEGCENPFIRHKKRKVKVSIWINVNRDGRCTHWPNKGLADTFGDDRIARFQVEREVEEGEGLE